MIIYIHFCFFVIFTQLIANVTMLKIFVECTLEWKINEDANNDSDNLI